MIKEIVPINNMRQMSTFQERVYSAVQKIPHGETRSYKEVAFSAGSPSACRAVGNILNKNHNPNIPCHRVVKSNGSIGGYNGGAKRKQTLLQKEGALKK
jgi:O-6-methylguanine DNA methyltransferase